MMRNPLTQASKDELDAFSKAKMTGNSEEKVDPQKILSSQPFVGKDAAGKLRDGGQIVLHEMGGKYFINDGNHRAANVMLNGKSVNAMVFHYKEQTEKIAKAAKKKPEDQDSIDVVVDWGDLIPEVTPYLETDAVAGATEFLTDRGIVEDSDMWTKVLNQARQMARERGAELVGKRITDKGEIVDNPDARYAITETTRENLRELISKSVDEGWTTTELQHNILQSEDFSAARALTISRTESMYAYNHGKHEAAKGTGQKFKQQIGSGDACEDCMENIEAGLIPIDEPFPSGDDCTPIHPNDRCGVGYSDTEDGD
jgi:hypothetical protein